MANPKKIADKQSWLDARRALLAKEKEFTRLRDALSEQRRALPWVRIEEDYIFDSPDGKRTLAELFGSRTQLLVYHFMFGADWDAGCPSCSFWADHFDAMQPHLAERDTSFAAISVAPQAKLTAFAKRMGWRFPWVSSAENTFNRDFAVSFSESDVESSEKLYNFGTKAPQGRELPGASAFVRDGDSIFLTYSTYTRGLDILNGTYHWLDLTAKGRDEAELPWTMAWVRRHDEYES